MNGFGEGMMGMADVGGRRDAILADGLRCQIYATNGTEKPGTC